MIVECVVKFRPLRAAIRFAHVDARDRNAFGEKALEHPDFGLRRQPAQSRCVPDPWNVGLSIRRQDDESVDSLGKLVNSSDVPLARAAASALGAIQSAKASQALANGKPADGAVAAAVTDAALSCAETLLAAGDKTAALAVYKKYAASEQKHVQIAAKRGMLAALGK